MAYGLWQGVNRERFVQSYTTQAMSDLSVDHWTEALVLDRQGRVIATCGLRLNTESICFAVPESVYAVLEAHLAIYCKMMRVSMTRITEAPLEPSTPKDFTPWITQPRLSGVFTAHDVSGDQIGLINFNKGCYLGQEIVARVHAKVSEHKKRLALVSEVFLDPDFVALYTQGSFHVGVLGRAFWKDDGVIYVWDAHHNTPHQNPGAAL